VHAVDDGAPWITDQVEKQFGAQGHYLVEFYHPCQSLGNAATTGAKTGNTAAWLKQKVALKSGQVQDVIKALTPHLEVDKKDDNATPVCAAYRYLQNRVNQLNYLATQAKGLPLGSSEIESAHRSVIQARLKIAGAWWKASNFRIRLALRVARANGLWERYWHSLEQAA